ncbi:MAG: hypothetical protein ACHQE5_14380 [Actinomycetes bacterium]
MHVIDRIYIPPGESESDLSAALHRHGRRVDSPLGWAGETMLGVLDYLGQRGVDLRDGETAGRSGTVTAIMTAEHKSFLDAIDPTHQDPDDLSEFFDAADDTVDEAVAYDALALLHEQIGALRDGEVLILHVG